MNAPFQFSVLSRIGLSTCVLVSRFSIRPYGRTASSDRSVQTIMSAVSKVVNSIVDNRSHVSARLSRTDQLGAGFTLDGLVTHMV